MKKRFIIMLTISAIVMLVLPWLAVTFVKGDAGMAACFLLFYAVNPMYSAIIGGFASQDIKYYWRVPVLSSVLYLAGTWIFFDMGEIAFILYAIMYFIIGIFAMLLSGLLRKKAKR